MSNPKIIYGTVEQPVHPNAQYLLREARLTNGTYDRAKFIEAIDGVSLNGVVKEECRKDINQQRSFLKHMVMLGDTVTIEEFEPDNKMIDHFVNTTRVEMHNELTKKL
mgnify:CR=1 FL=1|jgi:hypothetical protein